jgi:hypothetical protein
VNVGQDRQQGRAGGTALMATDDDEGSGATLSIFNPVAESVYPVVPAAARLTSLEGKKVGLYWNMKVGGDAALDRTEQLLTERYPGLTAERLVGSVGVAIRHLTAEDADRVAAEFDAVVGTTADCGACTSWLVHDMVELEKRGVPTVYFVADEFIRNGRRSAETFGLPDLPFAVAVEPFSNHLPEQIHASVDACVPQVIAGLTESAVATSSPGAADGSHEVVTLPDRWLTFEGADLLEAQARMQEALTTYRWSDGFPLVPPTERALEAMLKGTERSPTDVIGILEPGFGIATVEKIAANAVMAGCRSEHLPVVIAAVECLLDPVMCIRNKSISTGPMAPLVIVNGPIRDRIGLNSGVCALGPGAPSHVNTVIGRAVWLCMMNVGHTYAGISDMDTIGTPLKYSCCVAENEAVSPWPAFHEERGFDSDTSTVTVQFVYGICDQTDIRSSTPEQLIRVFATAAKNVGLTSTGYWLMGRRSDPRHGTNEKEHHTLLIAPEHAHIFANAGWSKDDIRRAMHAQARLPFELITITKEPSTIKLSHPELDWLWDSPETLVPVVEDVDCWSIAVVGGSIGRGTFLWGAGGPITRAIEE